MRLSSSWIAVAVVVVVAAVAAVIMAPRMVGGSDGARWLSADLDADLLQTPRDDGGIVTGAHCLGTDPAPTALTGAGGSTRFVCQMQFTVRPANVSQASWDALGTAMRNGDIPRVYTLLGLAQGASQEQIQAASAPWGLDGSRSVTEVFGVKIKSTTHWRRTDPAIEAAEFGAAGATRSQLLRSIPAIEAYKADHGTYSGMTPASLQLIDPTISAQLELVSGDSDHYCAQLRADSIIWSETGPGGAPRLKRC
jgi:hypothetical protein